MYALIQKENSLPTVVSEQSEHFPTYIMSGYEVIKEGTKREMNEIYEEMVIDFASNND